MRLLPETEVEELVKFCYDQLKINQKRSEYRELLNLIIVFLTDNREKVVEVPGSHSRARYMCKIIYALKMYLYRDQMEYSDQTLTRIKIFILYALKIHIKPWFSAQNVVKAPLNDLNTLKKLQRLKEVMQETAAIALKKMKGHLWYLSTTLIALAFFDDEVPIARKQITRRRNDLL